MPGFLSVLADLLGIPPIPGTAKYRDALHRCMKQRNEELDKPAEQRDAAWLLELTKRVLRMRIAMYQVPVGVAGRAAGCCCWAAAAAADRRRRPPPRCWEVHCDSSIKTSECSALSPVSSSLPGPLISVRPRSCLRALQAFAHLLRHDACLASRSPDLGCCRDCVRVRLRVAASLRARAAWHDAWALISTLRLEALEKGQPKPPLVLPYLEVQPHLAEGVPEELPASSMDRCAACQKELEEVRRLHRLCVFCLNAAVRSLWDWCGSSLMPEPA